MLKNFDKLHLFPVHPLEYENSIDLDRFCKGHGKAIEVPTFQNRTLFIGRIGEKLRSCIPYIMHSKDRHKTYEPFGVNTSIRWFFKFYGPGRPDNTVIVYGGDLSSTDKDNLRFCKENSYQMSHISEFKEDFQKLINTLLSEIEFAPAQKRKNLSSKLKKIEEECSAELK